MPLCISLWPAIGFLIVVLAGTSQQPAMGPRIVRLAHEGNRTCVAFSPDGKTLATGGRDNCIRLWDVGTGKLKLTIAAHNAQVGVSRLAFFPDGKTLASASWAGDGTVKLWDVAGGKQRQVVGTDEGGIGFLAVSPDGKSLAWGGKIHLYDVQAGHEARCLSAPGAVDSVAFSPDSKLLASANGGGTVRLWEVATGKTVRDLPAGQSTATGSQAVAFSRDGSLLATAGRKVRLWKTATGDEMAALGAQGEGFFCVAISPDGRFLAGGAYETLHVWELATRKEIGRFAESAKSIAFSRDGRWLAFGTSGGAGLVEMGELAK